MNSLFIFLIQSSIALLLFYLVYWAFLRKETHYNSNRFFLLFALLASILMPLIPLQYTIMVEAGINSSNFLTEIESAFKGIQPYVGSGFETSYSFSWLDALLMIYLTGTAIFLCRILVQTAILCIQLLKNKTKSQDGLHIVETEKYGLPFSFFNIVYINPKIHKQDVLPEILAHEMVHIREKHWADLLIIELLTVIFWFNPIIWFFEHSIKLNHEYLADHGVISNGNPIGKYQALLVNQLMGMQIIGITNNLNFGINTNRLKMMTKQKTPKIKALKLVWAMPVIAILLFAFAEPNYKVIQPQVQQLNKITSADRNIKLRGTVVDENDEAIIGVSVVIGGTTLGTTTNKKGKFKLDVAEKDLIFLSHVGKSVMGIMGFINKETKRAGNVYKRKYVLTGNPVNLGHESYFNEDTTDTKNNLSVSSTRSFRMYDEAGKEIIAGVVEKMPEYPGGKAALRKYVKNMQSKIAKSDNINGKAKIAFTMNEDGKPVDLKILEQDNELAGKGAIKLVKRMKNWSPGMQRNKAVAVNYILPVNFK